MKNVSYYYKPINDTPFRVVVAIVEESHDYHMINVSQLVENINQILIQDDVKFNQGYDLSKYLPSGVKLSTLYRVFLQLPNTDVCISEADCQLSTNVHYLVSPDSNLEVVSGMLEKLSVL